MSDGQQVDTPSFFYLAIGIIAGSCVGIQIILGRIVHLLEILTRNMK